MELECTVTETFGCSCQYHYQDSDYIAQGAFGTVYKAKITIPGNCTGEHVAAVKVVRLSKKVLESPESWQALRQRWMKVLQLKHTHLVAYHQVAITTSNGAGSVRFLMDYCNGQDLSKLMQQERANRSLLGDQSTVLCYSIQIADGLQFLHQREIIHRDLKPKNVLVKRSQCGHHTLLIGDLDDLVQMHRSVTTTKDIEEPCGTVRYMSPEMVKKFTVEMKVAIGRKTDMWSLGCIILELACCHAGIEAQYLHQPTTGERFAVQSNTKEFHFCSKINEGYLPVVEDMLPEFLATSTRNCLQVNSEDRMSPDELLEKFRAKAEVLERNEAERRQSCACGKHQLVETVKKALTITSFNNAKFYLVMLVLAGVAYCLLLLVVIFVGTPQAREHQ